MPLTTWEMAQAFNYCRDCLDIRVVILTGADSNAFLKHIEFPARGAIYEKQCQGSCVLGEKGKPVQIGKLEYHYAGWQGADHLL